MKQLTRLAQRQARQAARGRPQRGGGGNTQDRGSRQKTMMLMRVAKMVMRALRIG